MKETISVRILGPSLAIRFGGFACYAYVIRNKEGHLLHEACGLAENPVNQLSSATSSVAIYTALVRGLEWLIQNGYKNDIIIVKTSSKSLISQLDGIYQSPQTPENKKENNLPKSIVPLHAKALGLKSRFYKLSFELLARNRNVSNGATTDIDDETKEIEELLVLAYVEAEEKIMKQVRILSEQKSPFVTAAQLMKYKKTQAS
ncbi:MAG TPA: reverse transcriptase-like protein [Nitrososphaera sp.]|jgi:ribonuclease HI